MEHNFFNPKFPVNPNIFLDPNFKFLGSKLFFDPNFFLPLIFMDQQSFWTQNFSDYGYSVVYPTPKDNNHTTVICDHKSSPTSNTHVTFLLQSFLVLLFSKSTKTYWVRKKFVVEANFQAAKNFGSITKFLGPKKMWLNKLWLQKFYGHKKFLTKTNSG